MVGLGSFSRCYVVHDCLDFPSDDSVERRLVMQSLTSAQRLPPQFPTPAPPLQQQLALISVHCLLFVRNTLNSRYMTFMTFQIKCSGSTGGSFVGVRGQGRRRSGPRVGNRSGPSLPSTGALSPAASLGSGPLPPQTGPLSGQRRCLEAGPHRRQLAGGRAAAGRRRRRRRWASEALRERTLHSISLKPASV